MNSAIAIPSVTAASASQIRPGVMGNGVGVSLRSGLGHVSGYSGTVMGYSPKYALMAVG